MILRTMKLGDRLDIHADGLLISSLELVQIEHNEILEPIVTMQPGPFLGEFDLGVWPINERKVRVAVRGDNLEVEHRSVG